MEQGGERKGEQENGAAAAAERHRNREATNQQQQDNWIPYKGKHTRKMEARNKQVWNPKIPGTTFFISNLPDRTKDDSLGRKFATFGEVQSAYVAKKRDVQGNWFGFVRFINVRDKNTLLDSMQDVKMGGAKVGVYIAKYDRWCGATSTHNNGQSHVESNRKHAASSHSESTRKHSVESRSQHGPQIIKQGRLSSNQSFKDVILNKPSFPAPNRTIIIKPNSTECSKVWESKTIVVEAKSLEMLNKCDEICNKLNIRGYSLRHLGGLSVQISLNNIDSVKSIMEGDKEIWKPYLTSITRWDENYDQKERLAWLYIRGVPSHLYDRDTYDLIGNSYGRVVQQSEVCHNDGSLTYDRIAVLTTMVASIKEEVNVRWKNKTYRIWIEEDPIPWFPNFLRDDSKSDEGVPENSPGRMEVDKPDNNGKLQKNMSINKELLEKNQLRTISKGNIKNGEHAQNSNTVPYTPQKNPTSINISPQPHASRKRQRQVSPETLAHQIPTPAQIIPSLSTHINPSSIIIQTNLITQPNPISMSTKTPQPALSFQPNPNLEPNPPSNNNPHLNLNQSTLIPQQSHLSYINSQPNPHSPGLHSTQNLQPRNLEAAMEDCAHPIQNQNQNDQLSAQSSPTHHSGPDIIPSSNLQNMENRKEVEETIEVGKGYGIILENFEELVSKTIQGEAIQFVSQ